MILKYYYKGWNYVDGIDSLRWVNKELTSDLLEASGEGMTRGIDPAIGKLIEPEYDEETRIESIEIGTHKLIEEIREHGFSYIRVLIYKKEDFKHILAVNQGAYILNENGQTIESIR
jgi:hypothetical protein